ncbi:hypothetical protein ACROYT_G003567 [Oculina patagonica]
MRCGPLGSGSSGTLRNDLQTICTLLTRCCISSEGGNGLHRQGFIETNGPLLTVSIHPPSKAEIVRAVKQLKNGKAAGPDGIPPEALKIDPNNTAEMLHPLFLKIWEAEKVPTEWKHGYLVKLPKKGDLGLCNNWRGIMLLSIPSKVFCRIILERLKDALDKQLRCNQAGFRKDKSCTDHIATLRIIIEQSNEWQTPLYMNFIDFEKAFDSVDRNIIWQLMHHYGIPSKFIKLIQDLYESSSCQVIHNGKLTESFEVSTGVRQGCLLSPMIFIMVVDWIMREVEDQGKTGIQWTLTTQLHDLDYADDICLLSQKLQHMQAKTNNLAQIAETTGLRVSKEKTKVMRTKSKQRGKIKLNGEDLEDVESFTYLGSIITVTGGTEEDMKCRIGKARLAFNMLRPVWNASSISTKTKLRIFTTNVKATLLYGSETWKVTQALSNKLQSFVNKCLRKILKIHWPEKISNKELWSRTGQEHIPTEIARRKWAWIGHTLRKPGTDTTKQALKWNPQGKRKVGRPAKTWRRSTEEELKKANISWNAAEKAAANRVRWRSIVDALCSTRSLKE